MHWDFVGRFDELAALEAAWLAAQDGGDAPVMIVHGESGIGKTRTVAELASVVRGRGAEVLWGTCFEGGDAHPYGVWMEALREFVEGVGAAGLEGLLGSDVRWLAPLLGGGFGVGRVSAPAGVARVRLGEVLAQVLGSFERAPVVVLDDMQWAFPESLELFGHVSRLARGALVVVSCRGTGLELGHPLAQRLAQVHRLRSCEYLALGSLSHSEAERLLEQAAGGPVEAGLVDAVYEESGGNPFYLGELGRHLAQDGNGVRVLPESVRAAVGLRLAGLSAQTRQVLQLASVFGAGFGFGELAEFSGFDEDVLLDCLEQALAEELLRARDAEGERYGFAHALVRQTLYELLSPSRRARLHRRLAETLEHLYADDLAWVAVELVRHYHASATMPGAQAGALHALTAAHAARAADAPGDAVMVLHQGLDLVGSDDTATRALLVGALALAQAETGLYDDAPRTLERAVSLLEQDHAPGERIAELVYAVGAVFAFALALEGLSRALEPLIARALAAVGQTRGLAWARLKLLNRFTHSQTLGPVHVLRPVRFDPEAVQIARSEGTEAEYAFTIDAWDPTLGIELEQLIARIDAWKDPVARLRALANVVGYLTLVEPGSSPAADRLCAEFAALADDVGLLPHRAFARVFRAALLGARGEFDAAADQIEQARALFERQPAADSLVALVGELTAQHAAADWPRVAAVMWDLATSPRDAGWLGVACAALAAQAFASAGDLERAREVLGYILPELESAELLEPTNCSAIALAGAAVWELRAYDLAGQLLPRALLLADTDGREGYMTSSELTVARLCAVLGRFEQAVEYFARARVTLERRDQPVLRAIVDFEEALVRLEHKQPGAGALLAAAGACFEQLGMREWSRRAALVEGADELPDHLTAREGEILRAVADGKTNKEIAAELVLSVHTVERHVQNAYRKIGARNRADASTYVARVHL